LRLFTFELLKPANLEGVPVRSGNCPNYLHPKKPVLPEAWREKRGRESPREANVQSEERGAFRNPMNPGSKSSTTSYGLHGQGTKKKGDVKCDRTCRKS
jgi:hypothetical protein